MLEPIGELLIPVWVKVRIGVESGFHGFMLQAVCNLQRSKALFDFLKFCYILLDI